MEPTQKANNIGVDKGNVMIYTMTFSPAIKKNGVILLLEKLMYLEMIILDKLSQFQKSK